MTARISDGSSLNSPQYHQRYLRALTVACLWFVSHALYNVFSKKTFQKVPGINAVIDIIFLHFVFSAIGSQLYLRLIGSSNRVLEEEREARSISESRLNWNLICFCHFAGTLTTSLSYVYLSASFTQIFKALEPLCTVLLGVMTGGTQPGRTKLIAVTMIVFGVVLSANPTVSTKHELNFNGVMYACISTILFPLRNVLVKKDQHISQQSPPELLTEMSVVCGKFAGVLCLIKCVSRVPFVPFEGWASSFLFAAYQTFSFAFLSMTTAVTHSVINVFKRIFTLILSLLIFGDAGSPMFFKGLICIFVGFMMYSVETTMNRASNSYSCTMLCLVFFMLVVPFRKLGKMATLHHDTDLGVDLRTLLHAQCLSDIRQNILDVYSPLLEGFRDITIVDPAYHFNVGDNMISYAELLLLSNLGHTCSECGLEQSLGMNDRCDFHARNTSNLALWHGGGNWGDLYPKVHSARLRSFIDLRSKNVTIVGMPQTRYFESNDAHEHDREVINELVESGLKLRLAWRDEQSFIDALNTYVGVDSFLSPDIAFLIGPLTSLEKAKSEKVDIMFLLRKDKEKAPGTDFDGNVERTLSKHNRNWVVKDWSDVHEYASQTFTGFDDKILCGSPNFDFDARLGNAVAMLDTASVIVTDRLHASILALLMNKPHVYLETATGKLSATREVSFQSSTACAQMTELMYAEASSMHEAARTAIEFLNMIS